MVAFHPRYTGNSHPTPDISTENLRFLKTDQTLADIAVLINHIKTTHVGLENAKVIAYGYDVIYAQMAVWLRQKYSHLVDGVWAASASLQKYLEFPEFYDDIEATINYISGSSCSGRVRRAFNEIDAMIEDGRVAEIEKIFNFYFPLNVTDPIELGGFYNFIGSYLFQTVQYGYILYVQEACNQITDPFITNDVEAFANFLLLNSGGGPFALSFRTVIESYSITDWESPVNNYNYRAHQYMLCNEYSTYLSTRDGQMFNNHNTFEVFVEWCSEIFDGEFDKARIQAGVDRTNLIYGGRNPSVTNVIYSNGAFDPLRLTSVTESTPNTLAIVIPCK